MARGEFCLFLNSGDCLAAPETLMHLPLTASVVLAEKTLKMQDVLGLKPGEVMEFPKRADDPLELRVSGRMVADGTAVKLGERFGLRIGSIRGRSSF